MTNLGFVFLPGSAASWIRPTAEVKCWQPIRVAELKCGQG